MSAQSESAQKTEDGRGAQRQTLIWKGVLHHGNQKTDVRVRNISTTGALIEPPTPIVVGSEPVLKLSETVSIPIAVKRTGDKQIGVSFLTPFDLALLAHARPGAVKTTWTPPAYDSAVQAAWERRLRRLSPAELRAEFKDYITD